VVGVGEGDGASGRGRPGLQPIAINDAGQSVGFSYTVGGYDAVLWSPSGKATVLQDAGGRGDSEPIAINDSGQSVGNSGGDAVLWSPLGKATVLKDAGGLGYSFVFAINASGVSVGYSCTARHRLSCVGKEAVLWSPSGKATVLQGLGHRNNQAEAINDAGWSVGYSFTAPGGSSGEAVLWSPSGKATNLGALLGSAEWINNSGDILGTDGEYWFLLRPDSATAFSAAAVPEPSTWAMLLAGFVGLGVAGYRRARAGHATLAA